MRNDEKMPVDVGECEKAADIEGKSQPRQVEFFLAMEPPTTTHNALCVRYRGKGRGAGAFVGKSEALREVEAGLIARLARHAPKRPLSGALALTVRWCFSPRGRHKPGEPHTAKPDMSNMVKTLEDCLVRAGVMEDDRMVCEMHLAKGWNKIPGIYIKIEEFGI